MLFFLNQKGPLTKGIFRQSANVKSCRELKEKLNSGAEVQLDCESIFVIASVLKVGKVLPSSTPQHSSGERQLVSLTITLSPSAKDHNRIRILKSVNNTKSHWHLKATANDMVCQIGFLKFFHPTALSSSSRLPVPCKKIK